VSKKGHKFTVLSRHEDDRPQALRKNGDLLDYTVSLYMWFIKQCCQQLSQAIGL